MGTPPQPLHVLLVFAIYSLKPAASLQPRLHRSCFQSALVSSGL